MNSITVILLSYIPIIGYGIYRGIKLHDWWVEVISIIWLIAFMETTIYLDFSSYNVLLGSYIFACIVTIMYVVQYKKITVDTLLKKMCYSTLQYIQFYMMTSGGLLLGFRLFYRYENPVYTQWIPWLGNPMTYALLLLLALTGFRLIIKRSRIYLSSKTTELLHKQVVIGLSLFTFGFAILSHFILPWNLSQLLDNSPLISEKYNIDLYESYPIITNRVETSRYEFINYLSFQDALLVEDKMIVVVEVNRYDDDYLPEVFMVEMIDNETNEINRLYEFSSMVRLITYRDDELYYEMDGIVYRNDIQIAEVGPWFDPITIEGNIMTMRTYNITTGTETIYEYNLMCHKLSTTTNLIPDPYYQYYFTDQEKQITDAVHESSIKYVDGSTVYYRRGDLLKKYDGQTISIIPVPIPDFYTDVIPFQGGYVVVANYYNAYVFTDDDELIANFIMERRITSSGDITSVFVSEEAEIQYLARFNNQDYYLIQLMEVHQPTIPISIQNYIPLNTTICLLVALIPLKKPSIN